MLFRIIITILITLDHIKIKAIRDYIPFHFHFYVKIKIKESTSNGLDVNKCYENHDSEQHSRDFSRWLNTWIMLMPMVL